MLALTCSIAPRRQTKSDYLGSCAQFPRPAQRTNEGLYLVPRMRRDQLEEANAGPVAVEDAEITPRLLQKLLNETGDDPDQLPVLKHALLRAWNAWNAGTGQPVGAPCSTRVASHPRSSVRRRAPNRDGLLDGTARVWDAATEQPVGTPLQHQNGVSSAFFSPDGRRIVTASYNGTARVWDAGRDTCASEFPIPLRNPGLRQRCVAPDV